LSVLAGQIIKAQSAATRVFEYVGKVPAMPLRGGIMLSQLDGNIEFRNISFKYPSRPERNVLDHLSLQVPAGKVVALCGVSVNKIFVVCSALR
jgi:ATP-binding cassette subfamily B (MDR/TAP) protein 8